MPGFGRRSISDVIANGPIGVEDLESSDSEDMEGAMCSLASPAFTVRLLEV